MDQSLNDDFYINNNNDGFNLKDIFSTNLKNYLANIVGGKADKSKVSLESNIIAWIARCSTPGCRDILRISSEDYLKLDPPAKLFNNYIHDYTLFCKNMLKDSFIKHKTHKELWNHEGHLKMLRNKNFRNTDTMGLSINVYLPIEFLLEYTPVELVKWLHFVFKHSRIRECYDAFKVTKCIKEFTSIVKKFRDTVFGDNWYFLADLDTCFGYNTQSKLSDVKDDIVEWAEYKKITRDVSEDEYIEGLKIELRQLFKEKRNINDIPFDNFIENSNYWVVSGSSNGIKSVVYDTTSKEEVMSKAVKAALFVEENQKALIKKVKNTVKSESFSPSVKIEIGFKNRLILACGNIEYIQMTYISHHIEKLLKTNQHSTLFNDNLWKIKSYAQNFEKINNTENIFMPFDAAGFDKYVTLTEIDGCFQVIKEQIDKHYKHSIAYDDLSSCINNLIESLRIGWKVKFGEGSIKWLGGLPSGLRWTALLGTLINIARAKYIEKRVCKLLNRSFTLKKIVGQGDDDDFIFDSWLAGFMQFNFYGKLGIKAHFGKNFLDNRYTEYLKKLSDSKTKTVTSYPTRKITSLFFISPEKSKLPDESFDNINFGIYDTIRRRGYNIDDKYFENKNFKALEYIPRTLGGFGSKIHNYGNKQHKVQRRILEQRRFILKTVKKGTPLFNFLKKIQLITTRYQYDRKIFLTRILEGFGARLAPTTNISRVIKEQIPESNPLELLTFEKVLDMLIIARDLSWNQPRLKQEFAFLPLKEIIATMRFDEMLSTLREFCDPVSLNAIEYVLNKFDRSVAKLKISNIIKPKYEFKTPYSKYYSDEFMSAVFGDTLLKMTLNNIIYSDNDIMDNDLSFRNQFLKFELSMFDIFNNFKDNNQRRDNLLINLFLNISINSYN